MSSTCAACGGKLVYRGKGRSRKYCEGCTQSGSGGGAWVEAWLAEHRDELEAELKRKHAAWMAEMEGELAAELRKDRPESQGTRASE